MNQRSWWPEVEAIIEKNSLLKHPFYQAWQAGKLSLDDLRYYAIQYYPHVAAFPRYVSAVHSNTEDIKLRQMLLDNLIEEEKGPHNHPELWQRFAEGLGVNREEMATRAIQPETQECIEVFKDLSSEGNPLAGLAALYAYESQIPEISNTKIHGLKEFYGISDQRSLEFFEAHRTADVWHSREERDAILGMVRSEADEETVKRSVEAACKAVWRLLDGVVEARQICASCN